MNLRHACALGAAMMLGTFSTIAAAANAPADIALKAAIADSARRPENALRDVYRHPYETLIFWGVKPGLTVLEISPGGGYWTEILAPYAKATGSHYAATQPDLSGPNVSEQARKGSQEFQGRFAAQDKFGVIRWVAWGENSGPLGPPASADIVITARNIHDWMWTAGRLDKALSDFYAVLKRGGILAVEEHRADPRPQVPDTHDGYVNTSYVIAAVEKAGFKLDASSEINANPKDTKDYPFGVWTLPPTDAKTTPSFLLPWPGRPSDASVDTAKFQAIGESDRMTLRFRKP
jgi:predicted methyltransferase